MKNSCTIRDDGVLINNPGRDARGRRQSYGPQLTSKGANRILKET